MKHPIWIILGLLAFVTGCGPTVGDSCTTPADCGNGLCIDRGDVTPGGYCSRQCTLGDTGACPSGSLCIQDGLAKDVHACFLRCQQTEDCRRGYTCRVFQDSAVPVCVGPAD